MPPSTSRTRKVSNDVASSKKRQKRNQNVPIKPTQLPSSPVVDSHSSNAQSEVPSSIIQSADKSSITPVKTFAVKPNEYAKSPSTLFNKLAIQDNVEGTPPQQPDFSPASLSLNSKEIDLSESKGSLEEETDIDSSEELPRDSDGLFSPNKYRSSRSCSPTPSLSTAVKMDALNIVDIERLDDDEIVKEADEEYSLFHFICSLPTIPKQLITRPSVLPAKTRSSPRLTLILDLDETMVHSEMRPMPNANVCFSIQHNGEDHNIWVYYRPYLFEFLEKASKMFEIVVFTASQRVYADKLLDILDPGRRFIRHRLFREACLNIDGNYLKDLSILGRDLSQTLIVDNLPQAFANQFENGVPIKDFRSPFDGEDTSLMKLWRWLSEVVVHSEDVRYSIRRLPLYKRYQDFLARYAEYRIYEERYNYCFQSRESTSSVVRYARAENSLSVAVSRSSVSKYERDDKQRNATEINSASPTSAYVLVPGLSTEPCLKQNFANETSKDVWQCGSTKSDNSYQNHSLRARTPSAPKLEV